MMHTDWDTEMVDVEVDVSGEPKNSISGEPKNSISGESKNSTDYMINVIEKRVESDPTGRTAGEPGAKLDSGKPRVGLMMDGFCHALLEVAKVSTHGAEKYSDGGWLVVPDGVKRYKDAMQRHNLDISRGELTDPKSGLPHAAHAAWNALAILELMLRGRR